MSRETIFSFMAFKVKVWWWLPHLIFIFVFFNTCIPNHIHTMIQYSHPSPLFSEGSLHFLIALVLSEENLPGVPRWDLSSGLPYSRPAHYQLSHAVSCLVNVKQSTRVSRVLWGWTANSCWIYTWPAANRRQLRGYYSQHTVTLISLTPYQWNRKCTHDAVSLLSPVKVQC